MLPPYHSPLCLKYINKTSAGVFFITPSVWLFQLLFCGLLAVVGWPDIARYSTICSRNPTYCLSFFRSFSFSFCPFLVHLSVISPRPVDTTETEANLVSVIITVLATIIMLLVAIILVIIGRNKHGFGRGRGRGNVLDAFQHNFNPDTLGGVDKRRLNGINGTPAPGNGILKVGKTNTALAPKMHVQQTKQQQQQKICKICSCFSHTNTHTRMHTYRHTHTQRHMQKSWLKLE